jgi:hypothetical protein
MFFANGTNRTEAAAQGHSSSCGDRIHLLHRSPPHYCGQFPIPSAPNRVHRRRKWACRLSASYDRVVTLNCRFLSKLVNTCNLRFARIWCLQQEGAPVSGVMNKGEERLVAIGVLPQIRRASPSLNEDYRHTHPSDASGSCQFRQAGQSGGSCS